MWSGGSSRSGWCSCSSGWTSASIRSSPRPPAARRPRSRSPGRSRGRSCACGPSATARSGARSWINGVFGYALIARERQASALWLNVTALSFNVGLNFLLVPRYGIVAAAIVTVASELVILLGSYPLMRRYFNFFPVPRTLVPAVFAAAAMGGLLWLLDAAPLPVLVALGAAIYGGLMWGVRPARPELVGGLRG